MMGLTLASTGNLDTAEDLASAIDSLWSDCLRFRLTQGTARQRGPPRIANLVVHVGSHRRESVTVRELFIAAEKRGIDVDQIVYALLDDPMRFFAVACRRSE